MTDDREQDHISTQPCDCLESVHYSQIKACYKDRTVAGDGDRTGWRVVKPAVCQPKRQGCQKNGAVIDDIELQERYGTVEYMKIYITVQKDRTGIIGKAQQIIGFLCVDFFLPMKIGGNLSAHGTAAKQPDEHGISAERG